MKRNIVIVGQSQRAKSEIGIALASSLEKMFFECDEVLEYETACSIDEIVTLTNKTYLKQQVKQVTGKLADYRDTVFVSSNLAELTAVELKKMKNNCIIIFLKSEENSKFEKACDLVVSVADKKTADIINEVMTGLKGQQII